MTSDRDTDVLVVGVDVGRPDEFADSEVLDVTLTNAGHTPVVVAGRLAIGYEDSTDRELYVIVRDPETGERVGAAAQLYHRAPHTSDELVELQIGQSVSTTFVLSDWYTHPPGALTIQVVYDSDEVAQQFPKVEPTRVFSEPVFLTLNRAG